VLARSGRLGNVRATLFSAPLFLLTLEPIGGCKNFSFDSSPSRLFTALDQTIERLTNDARHPDLGIADLSSFENFLAREANIGGSGRLDIVPIWNDTFGLAYASYLAALLRRVVFVGEPALRAGLKLKRISLNAIRNLNDIVMRVLRLGKPPGPLGSVIDDLSLNLDGENFSRRSRTLERRPCPINDRRKIVSGKDCKRTHAALSSRGMKSSGAETSPFVFSAMRRRTSKLGLIAPGGSLAPLAHGGVGICPRAAEPASEPPVGRGAALCRQPESSAPPFGREPARDGGGENWRRLSLALTSMRQLAHPRRIGLPIF